MGTTFDEHCPLDCARRAGCRLCDKCNEKLAASYEQFKKKVTWAEDFSGSSIKLIGTAELLGAIGLVLPPVLDIAPGLAPVAATGLATTMLLAALLHLRRNEPAGIVVTLVLAAVAVFIAWGRFGPHQF